jgi:putative phosphoribosyl transferase
MGAIATGGVRVMNEDITQKLHIPEDVINEVTSQEQAELARREQAYRGSRPAPDVHGRTVILVDDGLATGSTMHAAIAGLRQQGPAQIIVAVPVGARETCAQFQGEADDVICARTPQPFYAVGIWYRDFSQTTDAEVRDLLRQAADTHAAA